MGQVNTAFECGAQTATVQPKLLNAALETPVIKKAVEDFATDLETVFGKGVSIVDL